MRLLEAIAIAGAHISTLSETFSGFQAAERSVDTTGKYPILNTRNDTSSNNGTIVNMFINDGLDGEAGYAASVVSACVDATVYAIRCTSAEFAGSATCGPKAPVVTVTSATTTYAFDTTIVSLVEGQMATVALSENCSLAGTTAATCTGSASASVAGTSTQSAVSTVLTGADYHRFDVAVTAGADKLTSPTGTCVPIKPNAAPGVGMGGVLAKGMACAGVAVVLALM